MEQELADEMTSHVLNGIPAEAPPTHRPLVLARTAEGATALMAAAGCPSPRCVELVSLREADIYLYIYRPTARPSHGRHVSRQYTPPAVGRQDRLGPRWITACGGGRDCLICLAATDVCEVVRSPLLLNAPGSHTAVRVLYMSTDCWAPPAA